MKIHDVVEKNWDKLALLETRGMGAPVSRAMTMTARRLQTILFFSIQTASCRGEPIPNSLPWNFITFTLKAPVDAVHGADR